MVRISSLFALCLPTAFCLADAGDDTLKLFLDRSELVVLAKIDEDFSGNASEGGTIVAWQLKLTVVEVLKGEWDKSKQLRAEVKRFDSSPEDRLPYLKKGERCIFFLKNTNLPGKPPYWQTVDMWFGVQPGSPTMAASLKRLVEWAEEDKKGAQKRGKAAPGKPR